jgi:ribonucleoside-triphosphate reductase
MTGGSLVHIQIGEKLTQIQAKKLINYTVNSGCEHFALNTIYSLCVDGHNSFGKYKLCPICGKPIKDYMTRVVGFFVPISS